MTVYYKACQKSIIHFPDFLTVSDERNSRQAVNGVGKISIIMSIQRIALGYKYTATESFANAHVHVFEINIVIIFYTRRRSHTTPIVKKLQMKMIISRPIYFFPFFIFTYTRIRVNPHTFHTMQNLCTTEKVKNLFYLNRISL